MIDMVNRDKPIVLKPTGTVHIANNLSLIERKLLNAVIYDSQQSRFKSGERTIFLRDVFTLLGLPTSENRDVIKAALRTLVSTPIEWNTLSQDKIQEWGVCTFLQSGKIRCGQMLYRLNDELVDKINTPTLFAKIQLLIQSQIKKRHALALYEFMIDYLSRTRVDKATIEAVPLDNLKKVLGADGTTSDIFKFFNRDILKPSICEINKHTELQVDCKLVRKSRSVVAISFNVEKNDCYLTKFDFDMSEGIGVKQELQDILIYKGISKRKAKFLFDKYDANRIRENIDEMEKFIEGGKVIKNIPAYLVRAIEDDYRPKLSQKQQHAQGKKQEIQDSQQAVINQQQALEVLQKDFSEFKTSRFWIYFNQIEGQLKLEESLKGSIFLGIYKKDGLASPSVRAHVFNIFADRLLIKPEETNLQEFIQWKKETTA